MPTYRLNIRKRFTRLKDFLNLFASLHCVYVPRRATMICKQSVLGSLPDLEVGQAGIPISSTKSDVEKSMLENI